MPTVLFDMDEVLVDFVGPWMQIFKPSLDIKAMMSARWTGATDLQSRYQIDREEFWASLARLPPSWWASLPWLPGARRMLDVVVRSKAKWALCSNPGECPSAGAGKMMWAASNFGTYDRLVLTSRKSLLAAPGVLLVDDMVLNVENFRQAGGDAILMGRPWNPAFSANSMQNAETALLTWLKEMGC